MLESTKYTIVTKGQRIEVSKAVYHAYHKVREAERYQNKLIRQFERSLEYFQEKGVNVEYLVNCSKSTIEDKLIEQEQLLKLKVALDTLSKDERLLIYELFFNGKSERVLAKDLNIPRMTLNNRKHRILKKMKKIIES